jgi:hypothetical protein
MSSSIHFGGREKIWDVHPEAGGGGGGYQTWAAIPGSQEPGLEFVRRKGPNPPPSPYMGPPHQPGSIIPSIRTVRRRKNMFIAHTVVQLFRVQKFIVCRALLSSPPSPTQILYLLLKLYLILFLSYSSLYHFLFPFFISSPHMGNGLLQKTGYAYVHH